MNIMIQQFAFDVVTNICTYTTTLTVNTVPAIQRIIRYRQALSITFTSKPCLSD